MKNLSIDQVIISASIITMIVTYFGLKFKDKDKKWHNHIAFAFFVGVFVLVYGFMFSKIDANPLLNIPMTVFILSLIILFTSNNKRKWYFNIAIALYLGSLTFGIQNFYKNNSLIQKTDIVSEKDLEKQNMMAGYSIFEKIAIKNNEKLIDQLTINNKARVYFEDYVKFKETVCSSKLDPEEKKMRLIFFNSSNIQNVLVYVEGIDKLSYLVSSVSNDLSIVENKNPDESIKISGKRHNIIRDYHRKIDHFVDNFEDCFTKADFKSNDLDVEIVKIDKPLDEINSSVMKIKLKHL